MSSSTASRGASAITIAGGGEFLEERVREVLILKGRVRLNPNNCLLRDTRITRFDLGIRSTRNYAFGNTGGVSNVYAATITHTGAETTFLGDFNEAQPIPPGRYESVFGFEFNNLIPALSQFSGVNYSSSPQMIVTVR